MPENVAGAPPKEIIYHETVDVTSVAGLVSEYTRSTSYGFRNAIGSAPTETVCVRRGAVVWAVAQGPENTHAAFTQVFCQQCATFFIIFAKVVSVLAPSPRSQPRGPVTIACTWEAVTLRFFFSSFKPNSQNIYPISDPVCTVISASLNRVDSDTVRGRDSVNWWLWDKVNIPILLQTQYILIIRLSRELPKSAWAISS